MDPKVVEQVWERFLEALNPLADAGKLGALLFQFPQWFPIGKRNKDYVLECKDRCAPVPICVEFRNKTWMEPDNQAETLDFVGPRRGADEDAAHVPMMPATRGRRTVTGRETSR